MQMEKSMIAFADKGEPSLLVLSVPEESGEGGKASECFAVPVMSRSNGLLLAVPRGCFSEELLVDMMSGEDPSAMIGPSKGVTVSLCEEGMDGSPVLVGVQASLLVVDFSDAVLPLLREYEAVSENDAVIPFSSQYPNAVPMHTELALVSAEWVSSQGSDRVNFYSALDEQVEETPPMLKTSTKKAPPKRVTNAQMMDQLSAVVSQLQLLSARQDQLEKAGVGLAGSVGGPSPSNIPVVPAVSAGLQAVGLGAPPAPVPFAKFAKIVGPPPRVKPPVNVPGVTPTAEVPKVAEEETLPSGGIASAIAQQSTAITALVAHLANTADPLTELQGGGSLSGTTKGVQRREKMQSDLASGTSTYYLQMMQQLHRRMFPARPVPKSVAEVQHLSFLDYLKETGGYRTSREAGLIMWLLGHVLDAASVEDMHMVRERLALLIVSLEQSVVDKGDWQVAFLLSLAEDPPISVYQDRTSVISPYGRPFSSLVPSAWSAVVLAYIKELEVLTTKKSEATSPKRAAASPKEDGDPAPSPKRKPRYPKKAREDAPPKGQ